MQCDLLVLGDTPDAWAAARDAARLGARVVVNRPEIDSHLPATGLAAVLSAFEEQSPSFLASKSTCGPVRPSDIWQAAIQAQERRVAAQAREFGIATCRGAVHLTGPDTAQVFAHGAMTHCQARLIVIAVGTTARRPAGLSLRNSPLVLPEDVARCHEVPPRLVVLGGNRTARAFARLFAAAGSDVTLVDAHRPSLEDFDARVLRDEVVECRHHPDGIRLRLASERIVDADALLFAANRGGATGTLGLANAGLESDDRGRLWCDDMGMTWIPTIAAAGEVVGYPRGFSENQQRIQRTVAAHLELERVQCPPAITIRFEPPASTPEPAPQAGRVRTKPRPRPTLRVFHGQ